MATKVLLLDALSTCGRAVYECFESTTYAVLAPARSALNWTDAEALRKYISSNDISIVINTAGWQESPDASHRQELVATAAALADAGSTCGFVVIHLSSYRVFGAESKTGYSEEDQPQPVGEMGEAFLAAERYLLGAVPQCICLRVSWLLETRGDSKFQRLLKDLTSEGPELVISHLYRGTPLPPMEVGRVVLAMVKQIFCGADNWGVFHLASGDACSSAEITELVSEILDRQGALHRKWRVDSLPEDHLAGGAAPASAVLIVRRCRDNFGYQVKSWRQGLSRLVRNWLQEQAVHWE